MKPYHFNPNDYGFEVFVRSESEETAIISLLDGISESIDKQQKELERALTRLLRIKYKYSNKNIHISENGK